MANESHSELQPDQPSMPSEAGVQTAFREHQIQQAVNGDYAVFSDKDDPTKVKVETPEETSKRLGVDSDPTATK